MGKCLRNRSAHIPRIKAANMLKIPAQNKELTMQILDCGTKNYREVLEHQQLLVGQRQRNEIPDTVIIVEHPPVITLGARKTANKLLVAEERLKKALNIDLIETRRGGGTTAHNPGQLVFYPIIHLQQSHLTITEYVRKLEETGIELLNQLGVESTRKKGLPGLWVENEKIASIGVHVSHFVTSHGMAINISNDLSIFDFFVPCGLDGVKMTSALEKTGRHYEMRDVKKKLSDLLTRIFA